MNDSNADLGEALKRRSKKILAFLCVNMASLDLPSSYESLPNSHILLSHVPASSPTPTPIILLTLHRPEKYNAFTNTMADELERAFHLFDVDDRVRCIVVTGHGKMFCAGADLGNSFKGDEVKLEHRDG